MPQFDSDPNLLNQTSNTTTPVTAAEPDLAPPNPDKKAEWERIYQESLKIRDETTAPQSTQPDVTPAPAVPPVVETPLSGPNVANNLDTEQTGPATPQADDTTDYRPILDESETNFANIIPLGVLLVLLFLYLVLKSILGPILLFGIIIAFFANLLAYGRKLIGHLPRFETLARAVFSTVLLLALCYTLFTAYFTRATNNLRTEKSSDNRTLLDSSIAIEFSKPLYLSEVIKNISFDPEITGTWTAQKKLYRLSLPGAFTLPFSTDFVFTPTQPLASDVQYRIKSPYARDIFGIKTNINTNQISTSGGAVLGENTTNNSFGIASLTPGPDTKDIALSSTLTIGFNDVVKTETVKLQITPNIDVDTHWDNKQMLLTMVPKVILAPQTAYKVDIDSSATSQSGTTLGSSYSWQFTTAAPLSVTATNPGDHQTGISQSSPLTLQFNENLNQSQPLSTLASLSPSTAGTYGIKDNQLTFTPQTVLAADTQYTLKLSKDMQSDKATTLTQDFLLNFRTSAAAVIQLTPAPTPVVKPQPTITPLPIPAAVTTPSPAPVPAATTLTINWPSNLAEQTKMETTLLNQINALRSSKSFAALVNNDALNKLAQSYCIDLAVHGYLGGEHQDSTGKTTAMRLGTQNIVYRTYLESLYADTSFDSSKILSYWNAASSNPLQSKFNQVGSCVAQDNNGKFYVVLLALQSN